MDPFKICSKCGHTWSVREDFLKDPFICLVGFQSSLDETESAYYLFNHILDEDRCNTTLMLNVEEFQNLMEARWFARHRLKEHHQERPHSSLGYQTPAEFAAGLTSAQARQTGAAPPTIAVASTSRPPVQAEATAKADGAQRNPLENTTPIPQPELS